MKRFTFLVEANGGTFVSQIDATSLTAAGMLWLEQWSAERELSDEARAESMSDLRADDFWVLLDGLEKVWCAGFTVGGEAVDLVHVVQTATG